MTSDAEQIALIRAVIGHSHDRDPKHVRIEIQHILMGWDLQRLAHLRAQLELLATKGGPTRD